MKDKKELLHYIGAGVKNAVHLNRLIAVSGMRNREVRKSIEELRRSGYVIISDQNGYYTPSNAEEIRKYIRQEGKRAKSIFYTLKTARQLLQDIEKEPSMLADKDDSENGKH